MSIFNILVAGIVYLLLMLFLGIFASNRETVTILIIVPLATYYSLYLSGLSAFILIVALGQLIGLVIGLLIYRHIDKLFKKAQTKSPS